MYDLKFDILNYSISFFISVILTYALILIYPFFKKILNFSGQSIQNIHFTDVPRFGGIAIISSFFIWGFIGNYQDFFLLSLFSIILIFFGIKEDFFSNVSPLIRFVAIFISSFLFLYFGEFNLPKIEIIKIGDFLNNNYLFSLFFFSFAITAISNGSNIIDGTNGLCASTIIIILACLFFLNLINNETNYAFICIALIISILGFLIFNYPWQKIFLGDTGAYFIGWMTACLTVIFFGQHPEVPSWIAISILFYPTIETIFSFSRKIIMKKSPFYPDRLHLHILIFDLFNMSLINKDGRLVNCSVLPFLSLIWASPLIFIYWIYNFNQFIFPVIILQTIFYIGTYYIVKNAKHNAE